MVTIEDRIWLYNFYIRMGFGYIPKRTCDKLPFKLACETWYSMEVPTIAQRNILCKLNDDFNECQYDDIVPVRTIAINDYWFSLRFDVSVALFNVGPVNTVHESYQLPPVSEIERAFALVQFQDPPSDYALPDQCEMDIEDARKWYLSAPSYMRNYKRKLVIEVGSIITFGEI
jgi:hypothetical protein